MKDKIHPDQMSPPEVVHPAIADRRNFALQIYGIYRLMNRKFDERAQAISLPNGDSLTATQWRMLGTIHANEGASQREIADILEISPVAAGQTIDRLERSEWVERRPDPGDRRIRRLHVTEAGCRALERLGLFGDFEAQRSILGMSEEEMDRMTSLLDVALRNLISIDIE